MCARNSGAHLNTTPSEVAMSNKNSMCPSAPFTNKSHLLGGVNAKGEIDYFGGPIQLTEVTVKYLSNLGSPEKQFRFTTLCQEELCGQWKNGGCSVGNAIANSDNQTGKSDFKKPNCGIRSACRWLKQEGPSVCKFCNLIITDVSQ